MMKIEVHHDTGVLASWQADVAPRVGDTISFEGARHDCRTVTRVDWGVYVARGAAPLASASIVEVVRLFVE